MHDTAHHIVALSRLHHLVVIHDGVKRTSTRKERLAVRALDGLLERALGLGDGVGEGEYDGTLVVLRHEAEDLLRERPADGGQAEERGRANVLDDGLERSQLRCILLRAGEVALVLWQLVASVVGNESLQIPSCQLRSTQG